MNLKFSTNPRYRAMIPFSMPLSRPAEKVARQRRQDSGLLVDHHRQRTSNCRLWDPVEWRAEVRRQERLNPLMPAISVIESHCIGCWVSIATGAQISLRLALMNSARSGNRWRACWRFTTPSDHSQGREPNRGDSKQASATALRAARGRRLYGSQNRRAALVDSAISCEADHPHVRRKKCRSRSNIAGCEDMNRALVGFGR